MGPAQGAHNRPVATPSNAEAQTLPPSACCARLDSRDPNATSGRVSRSASDGSSKVRPNTASRTMAAMRPAWLAWIAQFPPTVAMVAMPAKASAMPPSSGRPERMNG